MNVSGTEGRWSDVKWSDIRWSNGLIPVIAQDCDTGEVLMLAYMNEEALELTKKTGFMHYWSRSRKKIWKKGEVSGNVQRVCSLCLDCDGDALLALVEQEGNACHTGRYSCFFNVISGDGRPIALELWNVLEDRKRNPLDGSYTCQLLDDEERRLKKIAEEATEVVLAAKDRDKQELTHECADLIYHLMVVMVANDVSLSDVLKELRGRRK